MKKLLYFAILLSVVGCKKTDDILQKQTDTIPGPKVSMVAFGFKNNQGIVYYPKTTNVYISDTYNNNIGLVSISYAVSIFAGNGGHGQGWTEGINATFYSPTDICVDGKGYFYVTDFGNNAIRRIHLDTLTTTTTTTFAGSGKNDDIDGLGNKASFKGPTGIAIDSQGNLYVSESVGNVIRKITSVGQVTTFAGTGKSGSSNGVGVLASFNQPAGLAVDANNNLYVADMGNNIIRKITPDGTVTTLAGTGVAGATNDINTKSTFNGPAGLAFDLTGNLIVADQNNNMIRKVSTAGQVTTLAGNGYIGIANGDALTSSFNKPYDVAVDAKGNIFVSDTGNSLLRKITFN